MKCAVAGWLEQGGNKVRMYLSRFSSVQDFVFAALQQPAALLGFTSIPSRLPQEL